MMIVLFIVGIVLVLEFVGALIYAGKSASGLSYVICRPFGIPLSMFVGFITRVALIALAVFCLVISIPSIF